MKVLNNGAEVIEQRGEIVLAKRHHSYEPYVTWRVDENGNAYFGHYFCYLSNAVADFEKRTKNG